jgi:hypothetical protein
MADYTRSGGISTAKARRKDSAARNKAHGLATRGRAKRGPNETTEQNPKLDLAALVPEARQGRPRTYVMVEHRRRDTGAVARALDLAAPNAPNASKAPNAPKPASSPDDDTLLEFAVVCVTHHSPPVHYATAARARKEVKWSHKWCEDCRGDQARTPAARSKASGKATSKARNKRLQT